MQTDDVYVRLADLNVAEDGAAVLALLDMYAQDEFGDAQPLSPEIRQRLIRDLKQHAACRAFLAFQNAKPVGLAICFLGYSTFFAAPLLNIHDLAVVPHLRGRGIGRRLLTAIEEEARRSNCCRLTLEVRADNQVARNLYRDFGFDASDTPAEQFHFLKKPI